jgi:hypothetical protein
LETLNAEDSGEKHCWQLFRELGTCRRPNIGQNRRVWPYMVKYHELSTEKKNTHHAMIMTKTGVHLADKLKVGSGHIDTAAD